MGESVLSTDPPQEYKGRLQLKCPLKSRVNPHEKETEEHMLQWLLDFHLRPDTLASREKFKAYQFSMLAARTYPDCTREQLDIVADLLVLSFLLDDILDAPEPDDPKHEKKLRLLEDRFIEISFGSVARKTDHLLNVALADVIRRLQRFTDSEGINQFARNVKDTLLGMRWERRTLDDGGIPSLTTYTKMRFLTAGLMPFFDLYGMFMRNKFNRAVTECALVKMLLLMAGNHSAWTNDVFSFNREIHRGSTHNLVMVLKNEQKCSWSEAINSAVEMCDKEIEAFLLLQDQLKALRGELDAGTVEFVEGLKHWISGNVTWYEDTSRYIS